MTDKHESPEGHLETESLDNAAEEQELRSRREFLIGLGKWSRVVIVGAVAGGMALVNTPTQAGWLNRRGAGGGWVNGGGGGGWANRRGGGYGGSWINAR
jgi:hypothetical protein